MKRFKSFRKTLKKPDDSGVYMYIDEESLIEECKGLHLTAIHLKP